MPPKEKARMTMTVLETIQHNMLRVDANAAVLASQCRCLLAQVREKGAPAEVMEALENAADALEILHYTLRMPRGEQPPIVQ